LFNIVIINIVEKIRDARTKRDILTPANGVDKRNKNSNINTDCTRRQRGHHFFIFSHWYKTENTGYGIEQIERTFIKLMASIRLITESMISPPEKYTIPISAHVILPIIFETRLFVTASQSVLEVIWHSFSVNDDFILSSFLKSNIEKTKPRM